MSLVLLHPALVHFPIAFLIAASLAGLAYIHWQRLESLRIITWWAMGAGWFSLIAAIITGLIAQGALPPDAPYRLLLNWHTTTGLALAVLYADVLYRGWLHNSGAGKKPRAQRPATKGEAAPPPRVEFLAEPGRKWLLSLELAAGILIILVSGWLGGELVYTWGVNVMK